ncbi:MAG: Ketosteroid isomerase-like protein [Actinomycetospora sp.]|jgi:ketosteroid isomerase-like protein|nr:Ketosteroid isomerase-like protein [Actinomycetospora sp.]
MAPTSEVEAFLDEMLPRQREAEVALCRGEAGARKRTWSRHEPVTLFGAAVQLRRGPLEVDETFRWLADRLAGKPLRDYDLEIVAAGASGDLAYTVAFEHKTFVVDGEPVSYTLRVTHVYRREAGEWRIVHRHGDRPPSESATVPV